MPFAYTDPVGSVLRVALDGVAQRQRVTADNIANLDTPGYRASSVDFESSLRAAIASGDPAASEPAAMLATDTPVGPNGNNVDLRKETLSAVQSQFQYQILTRVATDRGGWLKAAAGVA